MNKITYNYHNDSKDIFSLIKDYDWAIIVDHLEKEINLVYKQENKLISTIKELLENKNFKRYEPNSYSIDSNCISNLTYNE